MKSTSKLVETLTSNILYHVLLLLVFVIHKKLKALPPIILLHHVLQN